MPVNQPGREAQKTPKHSNDLEGYKKRSMRDPKTQEIVEVKPTPPFGRSL
jgi:hypothetical protein